MFFNSTPGVASLVGAGALVGAAFADWACVMGTALAVVYFVAANFVAPYSVVEAGMCIWGGLGVG